MKNNSSNPGLIYDNIGNPACKVVNPTTAYTVLEDDNAVIAGANSIAITLDANSNSPVWITSVDGTTQRTGVTIVVGSQDWVIADSGASALCQRIGDSALWMIVGAKTAS